MQIPCDVRLAEAEISLDPLPPLAALTHPQLTLQGPTLIGSCEFLRRLGRAKPFDPPAACYCECDSGSGRLEYHRSTAAVISSSSVLRLVAWYVTFIYTAIRRKSMLNL